MDVKQPKLSQSQPMLYEIRVPGKLTSEALDWNGGLTITVADSVEGGPISTISSRMDQAALHGLLRHLYSMGLPLISVVCVGFGREITT